MLLLSMENLTRQVLNYETRVFGCVIMLTHFHLVAQLVPMLSFEHPQNFHHKPKFPWPEKLRALMMSLKFECPGFHAWAL